ncbi:hypothetical protein [Aeromicrobium sp.]|uniref:hypothetical protein n=1 Tax=Aeromicrobium sp. TaxID=1871063 RepID=UPI0019A89243|nr:hypothetical protein [Aeromicrobium sp.]MBC7631738.1 hypothetical protein [Aeromicrobium sp.]
MRTDDVVGEQCAVEQPASRGAFRLVDHLTVQHVLEEPPISRERFIGELTSLTLAYVEPAGSRA